MELLLWGVEGWGDEMFVATLMTIATSLSSYAVGLTLGCCGAALKLTRLWIANAIGEIYTTVFRGVPELLVIYLFFFGGNAAVMSVAKVFGHHGYIEINAFLIGIAAAGIVTGAYATETLRGGYLAIPRGQIEAAIAYGMSRRLVFFRILVPQALRYALPGLSNLWLINLKATALLSVIGLVEVTRQASIAAGSTYEYFFFYILAGIIYALLAAVSNVGVRLLEKRVNRGVPRTQG